MNSWRGRCSDRHVQTDDVGKEEDNTSTTDVKTEVAPQAEEDRSTELEGWHSQQASESRAEQKQNEHSLHSKNRLLVSACDISI